MIDLHQIRDCQHIIDDRRCTWGPNDHIHQLTGKCENGAYERHHAFQPAHEHRDVELCRDCGHIQFERP